MRASYEALGRGEVNPFLNLLADDIEWNVSGRSPVAGNYIGRSQVMDFFSKTMNLYQGGWKIEIIDVLASDTHGVVLTKESGQHKGKSVQFRAVHVYSIDNGKLKEFRVFYDDLHRLLLTKTVVEDAPGLVPGPSEPRCESSQDWGSMGKD